jgi:hypothetical protein
MALVIKGLDRGLDGPVHSFDLSIRPGVLRFGQAMVDIIRRAGEFKGAGAGEFSSRHRLLASEAATRSDNPSPRNRMNDSRSAIR